MAHKKNLRERYPAKREDRSKRDESAAGALLALLLLYGIYRLISSFLSDDEEPSRVSPSYEAQLASLDQTQRALRELDQFLTDQRQQLADRQKTLGDVRNEAERLSKVAAADRAVVEAIFAEQEARHRQETVQRWGEGIAVGVLSSTLFALLVWLVRRVRRRKGSADATPDR
jgi:septal ring factor EnvC (AmiA/AmiB activator)